MKEWLTKNEKLKPLFRRLVMGLILFPPLVALTKYDSLRKAPEAKIEKVQARIKEMPKKSKKPITPRSASILDPDPKP